MLVISIVFFTFCLQGTLDAADSYSISSHLMCSDENCDVTIAQVKSKYRYTPSTELKTSLPELYSILLPLQQNENIAVLSKLCGRINNQQYLWLGLSLTTANRGCFPSDAVEIVKDDMGTATSMVNFDHAFAEETGFYESINRKLEALNYQKRQKEKDDLLKYDENLKLRHHFADLLKGDKFLQPMAKLAEERYLKFQRTDKEKSQIYHECIMLAKVLMGEKDIAVLSNWPASVSGSLDAVRYRLADIAVWSQTGYMFESGTWVDSIEQFSPKEEHAVKDEPQTSTDPPATKETQETDVEKPAENVATPTEAATGSIDELASDAASPTGDISPEDVVPTPPGPIPTDQPASPNGNIDAINTDLSGDEIEKILEDEEAERLEAQQEQSPENTQGSPVGSISDLDDLGEPDDLDMRDSGLDDLGEDDLDLDLDFDPEDTTLGLADLEEEQLDLSDIPLDTDAGGQDDSEEQELHEKAEVHQGTPPATEPEQEPPKLETRETYGSTTEESDPNPAPEATAQTTQPPEAQKLQEIEGSGDTGDLEEPHKDDEVSTDMNKQEFELYEKLVRDGKIQVTQEQRQEMERTRHEMDRERKSRDAKLKQIQERREAILQREREAREQQEKHTAELRRAEQERKAREAEMNGRKQEVAATEAPAVEPEVVEKTQSEAEVKTDETAAGTPEGVEKGTQTEPAGVEQVLGQADKVVEASQEPVVDEAELAKQRAQAIMDEQYELQMKKKAEEEQRIQAEQEAHWAEQKAEKEALEKQEEEDRARAEALRQAEENARVGLAEAEAGEKEQASGSEGDQLGGVTSQTAEPIPSDTPEKKAARPNVVRNMLKKMRDEQAQAQEPSNTETPPVVTDTTPETVTDPEKLVQPSEPIPEAPAQEQLNQQPPVEAIPSQNTPTDTATNDIGIQAATSDPTSEENKDAVPKTATENNAQGEIPQIQEHGREKRDAVEPTASELEKIAENTVESTAESQEGIITGKPPVTAEGFDAQTDETLFAGGEIENELINSSHTGPDSMVQERVAVPSDIGKTDGSGVASSEPVNETADKVVVDEHTGEPIDDKDVEHEYKKYFEDAATSEDPSTTTTTATSPQAALDGQPSATSDSAAAAQDATVRVTSPEQHVVEQPNDVHTQQQQQPTAETEQVFNEKELAAAAATKPDMEPIEALDLMDEVFMSKNWLIYGVTLLQCYLVVKLITSCFNFSNKSTLDVMEKQVAQARAAVSGSAAAESTNSIQAQEEEARRQQEHAEKIEHLKQCIQEQETQRTNNVAVVDQWNAYVKTQRAELSAQKAKVTELDKSHTKSLTKINNLETSRNNLTAKLTKLEKELESVNREYDSVDKSVAEEHAVLEGQYNELKSKKLGLTNELKDVQENRIKLNKEVKEKTRQVSAAEAQLKQGRGDFEKYITTKLVTRENLKEFDMGMDDIVNKIQARRNFSDDLDEAKTDINELSKSSLDLTLELNQKEERKQVLEQQVKQFDRDMQQLKKSIDQEKTELEYIEEFYKKRDEDTKSELVRAASSRDTNDVKLQVRKDALKEMNLELQEKKHFHGDYKHKYEMRMKNIPYEVSQFAEKSQESELAKSASERRLAEYSKKVEELKEDILEIEGMIDEANVVLDGGVPVPSGRTADRSFPTLPSPPMPPMGMGMPQMGMGMPGMMPGGMPPMNPPTPGTPGMPMMNMPPEMQFANPQTSQHNTSGGRNSSSEMELNGMRSKRR